MLVHIILAACPPLRGPAFDHPDHSTLCAAPEEASDFNFSAFMERVSAANLGVRPSSSINRDEAESGSIGIRTPSTTVSCVFDKPAGVDYSAFIPDLDKENVVRMTRDAMLSMAGFLLEGGRSPLMLEAAQTQSLPEPSEAQVPASNLPLQTFDDPLLAAILEASSEFFYNFFPFLPDLQRGKTRQTITGIMKDINIRANVLPAHIRKAFLDAIPAIFNDLLRSEKKPDTTESLRQRIICCFDLIIFGLFKKHMPGNYGLLKTAELASVHNDSDSLSNGDLREYLFTTAIFGIAAEEHLMDRIVGFTNKLIDVVASVFPGNTPYASVYFPLINSPIHKLPELMQKIRKDFNKIDVQNYEFYCKLIDICLEKLRFSEETAMYKEIDNIASISEALGSLLSLAEGIDKKYFPHMENIIKHYSIQDSLLILKHIKSLLKELGDSFEKHAVELTSHLLDSINRLKGVFNTKLFIAITKNLFLKTYEFQKAYWTREIEDQIVRHNVPDDQKLNVTRALLLMKQIIESEGLYDDGFDPVATFFMFFHHVKNNKTLEFAPFVPLIIELTFALYNSVPERINEIVRYPDFLAIVTEKPKENVKLITAYRYARDCIFDLLKKLPEIKDMMFYIQEAVREKMRELQAKRDEANKKSVPTASPELLVSAEVPYIDEILARSGIVQAASAPSPSQPEKNPIEALAAQDRLGFGSIHPTAEGAGKTTCRTRSEIEDEGMRRAIEASLKPTPSQRPNPEDDDLALALKLSQEMQQGPPQMPMSEEEALELAMRLSMQDGW